MRIVSLRDSRQVHDKMVDYHSLTSYWRDWRDHSVISEIVIVQW